MRETSCDPQLPKAEGSEMDEADKSIAELRRTHFPKGSKFRDGGMEFLRAAHTGSRHFFNVSTMMYLDHVGLRVEIFPPGPAAAAAPGTEGEL